MKVIQSFVNCDAPTFRGLQYDIGGGLVSVQVSGWHSFKDYLSQISSLLPNGWTLSYSTSSDRVSLSSGTGSISIRFDTQSMAELLGNSSTVIPSSMR